MKNKYESEMLQVIHEDMKGMHQLGIINDARMHEFDEMCLVQEPESTYKTASPAETKQYSHITTAAS
ncbi:MAG: hypothetical protein FWC24_01770 [Treponema sp.]|nr:hypothetical protein [Treponema sp.]